MEIDTVTEVALNDGIQSIADFADEINDAEILTESLAGLGDEDASGDEEVDSLGDALDFGTVIEDTFTDPVDGFLDSNDDFTGQDLSDYIDGLDQTSGIAGQGRLHECGFHGQ